MQKWIVSKILQYRTELEHLESITRVHSVFSGFVERAVLHSLTLLRIYHHRIRYFMSQNTSPTLARDLPRKCQFLSSGLTDLERNALINDWRIKSLEAELQLVNNGHENQVNSSPGSVSRKISFEDETGLSPRAVHALRTSTKVAVSKEKKKKSAWSFLKKVLEGKSRFR